MACRRTATWSTVCPSSHRSGKPPDLSFARGYLSKRTGAWVVVRPEYREIPRPTTSGADRVPRHSRAWPVGGDPAGRRHGPSADVRRIQSHSDTALARGREPSRWDSISCLASTAAACSPLRRRGEQPLPARLGRSFRTQRRPRRQHAKPPPERSRTPGRAQGASRAAGERCERALRRAR